MKSFFAIALLASCLAVSYAEEITSDRVFAEAFDLVARASSTSEVLTLNITNLIIIIFLGIVIIAIGIGFGGFFGVDGSARSADGGLSETHNFSNTDLLGGMCFIQYTSGNLEKLSCMQRTACEDPKTAVKYLQAGKAWHKMHKFIKMVPFNDGYLSIMNAVEDATEHAAEGGDCAIYNW